MANDRMIHEDTGNPELIAQLEGEYGLDLESTPEGLPAKSLQWLAGILQADKISGAAKDGDRVIMNYFMNINILACAEIDGPDAIKQLAEVVYADVQAAEPSEERDARLHELLKPVASQTGLWFTMTFGTGPLQFDDETYYIPEILQGRTLTARYLTDEELERMTEGDGYNPSLGSFDAFATVRADGTPVDEPLRCLGTF